MMMISQPNAGLKQNVNKTCEENKSLLLYEMMVESVSMGTEWKVLFLAVLNAL